MAERTVVIPLAVAALLVVAAIAPWGAAVADDGDGITVVIIDDSPTPTPTPTSSSSTRPPSSSTPSDPDLTTLPAPSDTPLPSPTPSADPGLGLLQLSGITGSAHPTVDPFQGAVPVQLTIRNESHTLIWGAVVFELRQPFGGRLGSRELVPFLLRPGETTRVSTTLVGSAQWPLVQVNAVVTPRGLIDGVKVGPLERDAWLFNFPWLIAIILILLIAAATWAYALRRRRGRSA